MIRRTLTCRSIIVLSLALYCRAGAASPFAVRVIEYSPAPGQWVNDARFHDPSAALGRPYAGGFDGQGGSSLVSLGGFGGSIILAFDHTVEDHPLNPFGMDAIVFSNAFWVAEGGTPDANVHWAECATIEISRDQNGNGLADDPWFLIPGSHIPDPSGQFSFVTWDSHVDDQTYPPPDASWIPPGFSGIWRTYAYALPVEIFGPPRVVNPSLDPAREGIFGYAEYSPTLTLGDTNGDGFVDDPSVPPEAFYTVPDDPWTVGITAGSGGGDAFDVAWAIDPLTGSPANLSGFDFIRLTTAVHAIDFGAPDFPGTNEKSAEIDAVADAAPDPFGDFDDDRDIDLVDIAASQRCFGSELRASARADVKAAPLDCWRFDRQPDSAIDLFDVAAFIPRITGPRR